MNITASESGQRLDHVLANLVPGMGLRGRRRLCDDGAVLVNGRPARASFKLKWGDRVEILDDPVRSVGSPLPVVQSVGRNLAALFKPAGLHTENLAGRTARTLQSLLPTLLPSVQAGFPCLLNRLDFATSGLVLAALDAEGDTLWHQAQQRGLTEKRYLALMLGGGLKERTARYCLDTRGKERVTAQPEPNPDRKRHTLFTPLVELEPDTIRAFLAACGQEDCARIGAVTLAGCTIFKGARHQIRAHAAALGFPLLGDGRYGGSPDGGESFFLHHGRVLLPGFDVLCQPPWLDRLPRPAADKAMNWLTR